MVTSTVWLLEDPLTSDTIGLSKKRQPVHQLARVKYSQTLNQICRDCICHIRSSFNLIRQVLVDLAGIWVFEHRWPLSALHLVLKLLFVYRQFFITQYNEGMENSKIAAQRLAEMYADEFGGKPSGRYRISRKLLAELVERRRLYADDVTAIARALFEKGFVLIDMESFFVVMSTNAFVNYRRAGKSAGN
jgi:hypothetical protein